MKTATLTTLLVSLSALGVASCASSQKSAPSPRESEEAPATSESLAPKEEAKGEEAPAGAPQEEAAPDSEYEAEPSPAPASSDDFEGSEKKKSSHSLLSEQNEYESDLKGLLSPTALSCSDAKPIVDSICSIAERVCDMDDPSSLNKKGDCKTAKQSCREAKGQYREKCG